MLAPAIYLPAVIAVWALLWIFGRNAFHLDAITWRMSLLLIAMAALVLSMLYASPFGPAKDLHSAMRWFFFGYPTWFFLSAIWLVPGIFASRRLALNPVG
jgi:hypothetical protein